jgi:hypothetical protein
VYTELHGKKVFSGPVTSSKEELDFAPGTPLSNLTPDTLGVLGAISRFTPVTITDVDPASTSFHLKSPGQQDQQLFNTLRTNWAQIIGYRALTFALIYRVTGEDSGVWLYRLEGTNYTAGCHQI